MCDSCGCGQAADHRHNGHDHTHDHDHHHAHEHPHAHGQEADTRVVTLERRILSKNDERAARNRLWLAERGVVALNLISAPGTGKTFLLERTLERLSGTVRCAVIAGDQKTDNDARRLRGKGATVVQIETLSACHLDADRVGQVLPEVVTEGTRLLFIENVGNLVCPTAFDLGEHFKVALMSVTEGEDKPVKYPSLFTLAPVVVLTKTDLIPHLDWDLAKCRSFLNKVHPGVFVFELSARTGAGMDAWTDYLRKLVDHPAK